MNRITILCKKANQLVDKVVCEGTYSVGGTTKTYFSFKDIKDPPAITITCNGKYTFLESCSCSQHSIHGGLPEVNMKQLCSYCLAVYKSLGK